MSRYPRWCLWYWQPMRVWNPRVARNAAWSGPVNSQCSEDTPRSRANVLPASTSAAHTLSWSGPGRERHGRHQFGVIIMAAALVSRGPCPIEYELAPGMELQVERHRAHQLLPPPCQHVAGQPAAVTADRAVALQGVQKFMA